MSVIPREDYLKSSLEDRFIKLSPEESKRAEELHRDSLAVDLHTHILLDFNENVDRIKRSQVNLMIEAVARINENFADSMDLLGQYLLMVQKHPDFMPVFCADDILRAKELDKQAVMFQLEPQTFGRDLDRIEIAYGLGIRMALLTFNTQTYIGDGCGERSNSGLTYLGLEAVERMNSVGMLIDLSHCGEQVSLDAIEASSVPVMCNHVGARALYPQCKRLKSDEVLKALADKGGLAGVSAIPNQLSGDEKQGIEDLLNHVDHFVNLIGIDHVAIGLDNVFHDQAEHHRANDQTTFKLSYIGQELNAPYMHGIESPEEWPNITRGLVSRGYSDEDIQKIIGGNSLRVIREVVG